MTRARGLGLVGALALQAGCVHPLDAPRTRTVEAPSRAALPGRFVLVSWNVHKFRHRGAEAQLQRFGAEADVVLLQEATGIPPLPDRSWTMVEAFRAVGGGAPRGVATGATAPVKDPRGALSDAREPLVRTPKSWLATTIPLAEGPPLLVVNLHAINFRPANALRVQLATIDPVLADHHGPVIVAGDFNTWTRRRRHEVDAFAARCHLHRVFTGADAPRLDAIFVRDLAVETAAVVRTRASDHDALRVDLRVR